MIVTGSTKDPAIRARGLLISRRTLLVGSAAGAAAGLSGSAFGAVSIDVTQGNVKPMPIAIADFVGGGSSDADVARNVSAVITNNLKRSGLFAPIDSAAFIERISDIDAVPRFA